MCVLDYYHATFWCDELKRVRNSPRLCCCCCCCSAKLSTTVPTPPPSLAARHGWGGGPGQCFICRNSSSGSSGRKARAAGKSSMGFLSRLAWGGGEVWVVLGGGVCVLPQLARRRRTLTDQCGHAWGMYMWEFRCWELWGSFPRVCGAGGKMIPAFLIHRNARRSNWICRHCFDAFWNRLPRHVRRHRQRTSHQNFRCSNDRHGDVGRRMRPRQRAGDGE